MQDHLAAVVVVDDESFDEVAQGKSDDEGCKQDSNDELLTMNH